MKHRHNNNNMARHVADVKLRLGINNATFHEVGRVVRQKIADRAKTIKNQGDIFELCSAIVDGLWLLKKNHQPYSDFCRPLKTHVAGQFWQETKEIFSTMVAEAKIGKTKREVLEDFANIDRRTELPVLIGNCTIAPLHRRTIAAVAI